MLRNKLNPRAKYVYESRNHSDCCVSYFHMCRDLPWFNFQDGTFDYFFEAFMAGELCNGDYFEHVLHGCARRNEPNVLFFTCEILKADTPGMFTELTYFLGGQYVKMFEQDGHLLRTIMRSSSLELMGRLFEPNASDIAAIVPNFNKTNFAMSRAFGNGRPETFKLFRKRQVTAWRVHFTSERARRPQAKLEEK
ncbi:unnamed protein product, partial [Ixodes hexagonus]